MVHRRIRSRRGLRAAASRRVASVSGSGDKARPIPPALRLLPVPALILLTVIAIALLPALFRRPAPKVIPPRIPLASTPRISLTPVRYPLRPQSLDDLLALRPADLARVDIGRVNLLCATGLPGSEDLDIDHALTLLDGWADHVAAETDRHLYRVTDPRYAAEYRGSEPLFRASFLLQVLQEDLGVRYDKSAVADFRFDDSRVAFIHGMIPPPGRTVAQVPGGTCASMPVLYTAVGRRLGYPLRLVETRGHLFVRWDGLDHPYIPWRVRFNIEGSGEGFSTPDDAHYKSWPYELTDDDVRRNRYLISLSPAEELAGFLAARGHCGQDNDQWAFAAHSYELAARLDPRRPGYVGWLIDSSLRSGYRPATPQLARLVDDRVTMLEALAEQHSSRRAMDPLRGDSRDATHRRVTEATRFIDIPSQPPTSVNSHLTDTTPQSRDPYTVQAPTPLAPYAAPPVQPFDPHPQPLPFRSRP